VKRILVIGDLLTDRYRFLKPLRSDPANNAALVVEGEREEMVDGGAGNLVRNLESLCGEEVHFFYAGERFPIKIRYYVDGQFLLREDEDDAVTHDEKVIDEFVDFIEPEDLVIISDYHKGTVEQEDVVRIIKRSREVDNVTVFIDTNFVYAEHKNADWLKINLKTAQECVNKTDKNIAKTISKISNSNVIVTKGAGGFVTYLKDLEQTICFTKDVNKSFIDPIGAGDTFLAGFVSYMARHNAGELPALVYADIVAHLSTSQLGTIDVVTAAMADKEYRDAKTSMKEEEDTLYVHRTIDNV
jgi:bifunctional ADP-heptose synthase (sugar kinase/adenylyltransferase)